MNKVEPSPAPKVTPDPLPPYPKVEIPKGLQLDPKQPEEKRPDPRQPLPVSPKEPTFRPAAPETAPKLPPLELPGDPMPRSGGIAIPSPAPATPDPLIPPPSVPLIPEPKGSTTLPSLTLPPESPATLPKKPESTSRSSPLTEERTGPAVSVFPVNGSERLAGGYRSVGFYNHTASELTLTIEGRAVKLPAKSYLNAKLAPSFTWASGERAPTRETVPAGAAGLDIVFRDRE